MKKFIELPVNNQSLANRKKIFGIGINDASYQVTPIIDGKQEICPYYSTWRHMLERCYDLACHKGHPTYKNCTLHKPWLVFSNFKSWMKLQDWRENQLDKDILSKNNKHYSPDTCIFISQAINKLLLTRKAKRGLYKLGVSYNKKNKKYTASCYNQGNQIYLGSYLSEHEAHKIYCTYKANLITEIAEQQIDLRIRFALLERAKNIHLED